MVTRNMPRVQEVVLPLLRAEMPGVTFTSWVPRVDERDMPLINIRRLGGLAKHIDLLDNAVIEITAFHNTSLEDTDNLYLDARQVIWNAVLNQTVVDGVGHLHSFYETFGPTQFDSPYEGTWRIQGLIQLGLRPPRS